MNVKQVLFLYFIILCVMGSCTKSGSNPAPAPVVISNTKADTDVYVCGSLNTAGDTSNVATYWKNGVATKLTNSSYSYASAIVANGTDIFIAGTTSAYHSSQKSKAVYWKNGVLNSLTDGSTAAYANDIAISGTDVYVVGGIGKSIVYWKNGVPDTLNSDGNISGIIISGTDVYISGTIYIAGNNTLVPVYWKNGVMSTPLNNAMGYSFATGIAVQNNNVLVAYYNFFVVNGPLGTYYWENGVSNLLSGGLYSSYTNRMLASGNDIYITGYTSPSPNLDIAAYWKNNTLQTLATSAGTAVTIGITVVGNDVYVTGYANGRAGYWKNGVSVKLGDAYSAASGIVVIPH